MNKAETFRLFLESYEQYIDTVLKPEHRRIVSLLERWKAPDYWTYYAIGQGGAVVPSPIKAIYTRIKRPERVVDKILGKNKEYPAGLVEDSFQQMHDCIGVRIIVYFLCQLPYIDRELRTSDQIELSTILPPKAYLSQDLLNRFGLSHITHKEKESGYASLHYVARLKSKIKKEKDAEHPWFEIQVRTLAQELWSEMEHIMAYKAETRTNFSARRRFQILSREICAIDEHFNLMYEEQMQKQQIGEPDQNDQLNPETLPYALSLLDVQCAQQDFDTILTLLHSRGIHTLKDFSLLATPSRMDTINNTYVTVMGRQPTSFERIASLGALMEADDSKDESNHIASQIEYSRYWNRIRKQITHKNNSSPRSYD